MIYVHLTPDQRDELQVVSRQAIGRVALRAHMVLLSDRGFTVQEIAAIHDCGEDVVRTWLHRYECEGMAGLEDDPRELSPAQGSGFLDLSSMRESCQSPPCSGHVQACWSVALLTAFLARRFRLLLSCASVRRFLHQMGWRSSRPRLAPARKPDPEAASKVAALHEAQALARGGLAHLLSLDESDLHLLPLIRAMWMRRPTAAHPDRL
jgi:transposase